MVVIPKSIKTEHIITAIEHVFKEGYPENREATKYSLVYKEKNYPPNYIVSIANTFANGTELSASDFNGGEETNKFLKSLGFMIQLEIEDNTKESLADQFNKDVIEAYKTAKSIGYNASVFIQLVSRDGALKVAKDFIHKNQATSGFEKLWEKGRLDLTVEAQTLLPMYRILFTVEERMAAFARLKSYNYEVQGVVFDGGISIEVVHEDILADDLENGIDLRKEGAATYYYGKRYERDEVNRKRAIDIHGLTCKVCDFNFEGRYGVRGKDFIEIHHINPLSQNQGVEMEINPETDLIPVCSNCHRMIHRKHKEVLTIDQLRCILIL